MATTPESAFGKQDGSDKLLSAAEAGLRRRNLQAVSEPVVAPELAGDLNSAYEIAEERFVPEPIVMQTKETPLSAVEQPTATDVAVGLKSSEDLFPPRSEAYRPPQKGRFELLKSHAAQAMRTALAGVMLLGATAASTTEVSAKPNIASVERVEKETKKTGSFLHHLHWMHWGKNKEGKEGFNFWALLTLSPAQWEWSSETTTETATTRSVPYEYARQFAQDSAADKPLRPADRDKVAQSVEDQMKKRFVETISSVGTPWNIGGTQDVRRYRDGEPTVHQGRVTSIKITGFASPEGPERKGPSTLQPGYVDTENIALAKKRAENMVSFTDAELTRISAQTNISVDVLKQGIQNVEGKEGDWSLEEQEELRRLSSSALGVDDAERLFNLVADYNKGKITDPNVVAALDRLVAGKRRVEITVTTEGNQKETLLVPLPLLLLLGLIPLGLRRRRGPDQGPTPPTVPQEQDEYPHLGSRTQMRTVPVAPPELGQTGRSSTPENSVPPPNDLHSPLVIPPPFGDFPERERPWQPEVVSITRRIDLVPELVRQTALPERNAFEFKDMEERALIDDLYVFLDDPETVRRGIDYKLMAERMYQDWNSFKTDEDRELVLANEILEAWQKHDRQCRIEADVPEGELDNGLNYKEQPNQIKWARMHARGVVSMVKDKMELPERVRSERKYIDILSPRVEGLIARRVARETANG